MELFKIGGDLKMVYMMFFYKAYTINLTNLFSKRNTLNKLEISKIT